MKEIIKKLKNKSKLPYNLDFSRYNKYDLVEGNEYFYLNEGKEHYQLLAYLSNEFNNGLFFDIGTYRGSSSLALSYNKNNKVISYDIINQKKCNFLNENNIEFIIGNSMENENLLKSDLILLDTAHDGVYESRFLKYVKDYNYKGIIIMDDVNLYPVLKDLAKQLENRNVVELIDLTSVGHFSGTLALLFN
jgi:predicted O-methyltransferase YrrM